MLEIDGLVGYIKEFQFEEKNLRKYPVIQHYIELQVEKLQESMTNLSGENFWKEIPVILGIDSKLVLLRELLVTIEDFDFTDKEVINMVEQDYRYYNKELCGYNLNDVTSHSLIFKIE